VDFVDSQNYTFKEHILMLFQIHLELLLVQHCMVVQTLLCLHTQPLVIVCMFMYAMHVLNSMNNQNGSNILYFKAWIIWNKSLLTIPWIFNFFHLLIYQWKLNNEIMDSCMAKYNPLGYLTILYSIGIPSFNQLVHQKDVNLALKDLLHQNLSSNPFIQKYITNIEKPNPTHGLCVLSSSIVK